MTKERPILFSGPMVRAIIAGRKTQTRRPYKPSGGFPKIDGETTPTTSEQWTEYGPSRYGNSGDRLWVKEGWRPAWHDDLYCTVQYAADSSYRKPEFDSEERGHRFADLCEQSGDNAEPWHPSIYMWREMSRLTLEVTGVRVERLQEISESDAIAEGVQTERDHYGGDVPLKVHGSVAWHRYDERACSAVSAVESYRTLWDSINGKTSWDANPWVWVVEFKVLEVRK